MSYAAVVTVVPTPVEATIDSAQPLPGWLLVCVVALVTVVIVAMFVLTFYNLSAPRSTMRNFFGLKWRSPLRRRDDAASGTTSTPGIGPASGPAVSGPAASGTAATRPSPFDKLLEKGGASQAATMKLLDTLSRSARVGKRTTRTTLAITGFSLLAVIVVAVLGLSGQGVRDLRTQVAAGVVTLVATIAGFYFGSQAATDNAPGGATTTSAGTQRSFIRDAKPGDSMLTVGTPATYAPGSTGVPPISVALTAGRLPAGLALDPGTGAITGVPSAGSAGTYPVTLTALYADNTYATVDELLHVTEPSL